MYYAYNIITKFDEDLMKILWLEGENQWRLPDNHN